MSQIRLTTGPTQPQPPIGQVSLYAKSSDKRLYYRDDTGGPEIGPLAAGGGGVTDLQTAYDGGNSITIPLAGGPVTITNPANSNPGISVNHTFLGGGNGIQVTMGGSSTGSGIEATHSGIGPAIAAVSLFTGDAFSASVQDSVGFFAEVNGSGAGRGVKIDFTAASSGVGVEITSSGGTFVGQSIVMDPTSTAPGLAIIHPGSNPAIVTQTVNEKGLLCLVSGTGDGVKAELTSVGATGNGFLSRISGASAANGMKIDVVSPGASGIGLDIHQGGTGLAIRTLDPANNIVFTVDNVGNTSTPSVTFLNGGPNTVTVVGKSGVIGEPNNPRAQLPGGVNIGALGRVWHRYYVPNVPPFDLETDPDTILELPTCYSIQHATAGFTLYLPKASRFHNGDEIRVVNISLNTLNVTSFGGSQDVFSNFGITGSGPFVIGPGLGLRFMAYANTTGGIGAYWVLLSGGVM